MNKTGLIFIMVLMTFLASADEEKKTIYKYTDEKGVTHYSETKPNDNYQEADDLPQLSVVPSIPTDNQSNSTSQSTKSENKEPFEDFKVTAPTADQNIWGTGYKLTASVTPLTDEQLERYWVQFVIDGEKQKPSSKSTQTFENVYRGEHTLSARLVNKFNKKVIKKTKKVTFFMHQNTKK